MKYLVDTNVLSELTKPQPQPRVVEWLKFHNDDLVVNPVVRGELHFGILLLPPGRKRRQLLEWYRQGASRLRVVDFDAETGDHWATLLVELRHKGRAMPVKDSLIAASARQYNLVVATRNVDDYNAAGIRLVDPFTA